MLSKVWFVSMETGNVPGIGDECWRHVGEKRFHVFIAIQIFVDTKNDIIAELLEQMRLIVFMLVLHCLKIHNN